MNYANCKFRIAKGGLRIEREEKAGKGRKRYENTRKYRKMQENAGQTMAIQ
jgi:hypothetical protein